MLSLKQALSVSSNNAPTVSPNTYSIQLTGTEYMTADLAAGEVSTTTGSISVWTKVSTMSSSGALFRCSADASNFIQMLYHAGTNEMRFAYRGAATSRTVVITEAIENDGDWHHILATWTNSTNKLEIFLDGVSKASQTTTLGVFSGTPSVFDIGQNTAGSNYYKGYISNFAFFERVVSIGEVYIQDLQPINLTGITGLVGYWKFDEGSGTRALDSSSNGRTGELVNSPSWTTDTP